jgi:hypothetical protein
MICENGDVRELCVENSSAANIPDTSNTPDGDNIQVSLKFS